MIGAMLSPLLLLIVLVAGLIALMPVWRLRVAGWPTRWLVAAWLAYAVLIFVAVRLPALRPGDPDPRARVPGAVRGRARAGDPRRSPAGARRRAS